VLFYLLLTPHLRFTLFPYTTLFRSPFRFAGSGGHNQTRRQIDRLVREGKAAMLCQEIADKVGSDAGPVYTHVVTVRVVTGEFRFDDYFSGNKTPEKERIRATCQVARTEQAKEVGH